MKVFTNIVSSGALVVFGVLVLVFSLQIAQTQQTRAASAENAEQEQNAGLWWLNVRMPGSIPYLAFRAQDKVEDMTVSEKEKTMVYLGRVRQRLTASEYAQTHGQEESAITTLYKAFGYLHLAAHHCQPLLSENDECTEFAPLFTSMADSLQQRGESLQAQSVNDASKARVAALLTQLTVMREQFSF